MFHNITVHFFLLLAIYFSSQSSCINGSCFSHRWSFTFFFFLWPHLILRGSFFSHEQRTRSTLDLIYFASLFLFLRLCVTVLVSRPSNGINVTAVFLSHVEKKQLSLCRLLQWHYSMHLNYCRQQLHIVFVTLGLSFLLPPSLSFTKHINHEFSIHYFTVAMRTSEMTWFNIHCLFIFSLLNLTFHQPSREATCGAINCHLFVKTSVLSYKLNW